MRGENCNGEGVLKMKDESELSIFIPYLIGSLSAQDQLYITKETLIHCINLAYSLFEKEYEFKNKENT